MTDKRKQIQDKIYQTLVLLDPSKVNAEKYKVMFDKMSDNQFADWIEKFIADNKSNFRVDIEEFGDGSRSLKFDNIEKAAKYLNIKLFEYMYMPHVSSNPNRPVRTKQRVLTGYLNIKRPQQLVTKKTGFSLSDNERDEWSGNAKGESKSGTQTPIENELLAGVGGEIILSELVGARGDNVAEYDNMLSEISKTGSVKLEDIKTGIYDKPTVLKTDLLFAAMGIKTDLVSESYYSIDKIKKALETDRLPT